MKTKQKIRNLKNLRNLRNLKNLISLASLISLISLTTATAQVSNTRVDVTDINQVTVTYNLIACYPVNTVLLYSPDKCTWYEAVHATGALLSQSTGTNKEIVWNKDEDNVGDGKFYFKVEPLLSSLPPEANAVLINGVKWADKNLASGGWFVANDYDYGALYQWGRQADGHECRNSPCFMPASAPACGTDASTQLSAGDLDANGQPSAASGAIGKFIRQNTGDYDWRTTRDDALWNSGTESSPIKNTAADPCPTGWRVPTLTELNKLAEITNVDVVWTTNYKSSGINGCVVKDKATSASIFLPAGGFRMNVNGLISDINGAGYYWSSSIWFIPGFNHADFLRFVSNEFSPLAGVGKSTGNSIRCVKLP